jgi:excisionase family DNA binding protein
MMEYCTIQDGAKLLEVSRPTVYKLIKKKKLKRYKVLGRPALKLVEVADLKTKQNSKSSNGNGSK